MQVLKATVIIMWVVVATIAFGTTVLVVATFTKGGNWPHRIARCWARTILWLGGIKVTVKGLANFDPDRPVILMSNHQSNFDIPVMLARLPFQFRWLAKAELFNIPIFGPGMRGCGYISIDRSNRKAAFLSLKRAAATIRNGVSVLIYPEGTRSADGHIREFKKGGFILAVESGVPIVPVVIQGTWPIMPKGSLMVRPGPVTLELLPVVETKDYSRASSNALRRHVQGIISDAFYQND